MLGPTVTPEQRAADLQDLPTSTPAIPDIPALLATFRGNQYRLLLRLLRDPDRPYADICREIGISDQTVRAWRSSSPAYAAAMRAVQGAKADLRAVYAKEAFLNATANVADAMIAAAVGSGRDAQRARERILETVGVLPKQGQEQGQAPVQVTTHTYVLVEPGQPEQVFQVVKVEPKAISAPSEPEATGKP